MRSSRSRPHSADIPGVDERTVQACLIICAATGYISEDLGSAIEALLDYIMRAYTRWPSEYVQALRDQAQYDVLRDAHYYDKRKSTAGRPATRFLRMIINRSLGKYTKRYPYVAPVPATAQYDVMAEIDGSDITDPAIALAYESEMQSGKETMLSWRAHV